MDNLSILFFAIGGLFAALGMFLILAAFCRKGCGWLFFGVGALIVSLIFGAWCPAIYSAALMIGLVFGALLFAVVRFLETRED